VIAIMAPLAVPRKLPIYKGKCLGVRDSRPLGSGVGSSAFFSGDARKYWPNGGMDLRPPSRRQLELGSMMAGDHGPFRWSLENARLQGKSRRVRGPRSLGAAMDSSAFSHVP
jgi:hypothetical protein